MASPDHLLRPDQLDLLPKSPGVYFFWSQQRQCLYVGKAKVLANRVSQYFQKGAHNQKTMAMVAQVAGISTVSTLSEHAALILENEQIKALKPKYNILLKDDKSFPYLYLSSHSFPRIGISRDKKNPKSQYFGPFTQVRNLRWVVESLQKLFLVRTCSDSMFRHRSRPCLLHQIKRCSAPCVNMITVQDYQSGLKDLSSLLQGRQHQLIQDYQEKMTEAAAKEAYEEAARYRDLITGIQKMRLQEQEKTSPSDFDVAVAEPLADSWYIQILFYRKQKLINSAFHQVSSVDSELAILPRFLLDFYTRQALTFGKPSRVVIADLQSQHSTWKNLFAQEGLTLISKIGKDYAPAVEACRLNLKDALHRRQSQLNQYQSTLDYLAGLFYEEGWQSIECIDISHTFGVQTKASCVRLTHSGLDKSRYRSYNLETGNDDYASMRALVEKRYKKLMSTENAPDLLLIDGGRAQLDAIIQTCVKNGLSVFPMMAISKDELRRDGQETYHYYPPGSADLISFQPPDSIKRNLELLRNEAHRFALKHHRKSRSNQMLKSQLTDIEGIGPTLQKRLLLSFGGQNGLSQASVAQLAQVPGISQRLAEAIVDYFQHKSS